MRRIAAIIVVSTAVVVALAIRLVDAQPGVGFSKTAPLSGNGSSGNPLKLTACAAGSGYIHNGTAFACTATQQRVTTDCGAGSAVRSIGSNGVAVCIAAGGTGDIEGVTANSPLNGGGTSGTVSVGLADGDRTDITISSSGTVWNIDADTVTGSELNITATNCTGQFVEDIDSNGVGTCVSEVGDISSVVAGNGLSGGATSGAATVDVSTGTGITITGDAVTLNMTAQTCSAGQHISAATATGVFTCSASGSIDGSGTANKVAVWSDSDTLTARQITDDGTNEVIVGVVGDAATRADARLEVSDNGDVSISVRNSTDNTEAGIIAGGSIVSIGSVSNTNLSFIAANTGVATYTGSGWSFLDNTAITGTFAVSGTTTFSGHVGLGNAAADVISLNGMLHDNAASPALSACSGAGSAIIGGNNAMTVTSQTAGTVSCTMTFGTSFTSTPSCTVTPHYDPTSGVGQAWLSAVSTSAITVSATGTGFAGSTFSVHCIGT